MDPHQGPVLFPLSSVQVVGLSRYASGRSSARVPRAFGPFAAPSLTLRFWVGDPGPLAQRRLLVYVGNGWGVSLQLVLKEGHRRVTKTVRLAYQMAPC